MEENMHRLKVQEETSKRFLGFSSHLRSSRIFIYAQDCFTLKPYIDLRSSRILFYTQVIYCNIVCVQGGGRPIEAAAGGAKEDYQPHPRDEHLQFLKVG